MFAFVASLLFGVAGVISGVAAGKNKILAKFIISLGFLLSSLLFFLLKCLARKNTNSKSLMHFGIRDNRGKLNTSAVYYLLVGGALQFVGSLLFIASFTEASKVKLNQGICASAICISVLLIAVVSYYIFGERISYVQAAGMVLLLIGIMFLATSSDLSFIQHRTKLETKFSHNITVPSTLVPVMIGRPNQLTALCAGVAFALQTLVTKYLKELGVEGLNSGIIFIFIDGVAGTLILIVFSFLGMGISQVPHDNLLLFMSSGRVI